MGQSLPTTIVSDQAYMLKKQQQKLLQENNEINKCLLFSSHFNEISLDLSQTDYQYQLTNRSENKLQSFESTLKQKSKILQQQDIKKEYNSTTRFNQDNDLNQSFGSHQYKIRSKQQVSEYEEDLTDDLCSDNSSIQNISKDFAQLKKGEQNKKPIETSYITNNKFWQQDSSLIPNIQEHQKLSNQSSFHRIIYNSNKMEKKQSPQQKQYTNCEKLFTQPEPTSPQEIKLSIDSSKQSTESMREKFDRLLKQNGKQGQNGQNKLKYFNHKFFLSPKDTDTEEELIKAITSKQTKKPQNIVSPRNIQSPKKTYLEGAGYSKKSQQQKQNLQKPLTPKQQNKDRKIKQQQNQQSPQSPLQDQLLKYQQARELLQKPQIKPDDMRAIQTELQRLSTQVKNQIHQKQQNYNQLSHFDDNFGEQLLVEVQSEIKNLQKTIKNHISPSEQQFNDDDQIMNKLPDYREKSIDLERLSSYQENLDQ